MIYWYTGQPGHGKTLCAIARAMEFKEQGRLVYVCNVRDFDYEKTGMEKMTPADFRDWMNFLPDGAVCLVDEAYEQEMLPKRPPGSKVPQHVEKLATHRHRGLDFIFVCQSPDKQVDQFVHDLIERHIHVRRRFGTSYQHLREFDRYERNPEKATPLVVRRQRLPKKAMGTYKSTEMDTTERRIPWFYIAFLIGIPAVLGLMYYTFGNMGKRLGGSAPEPALIAQANAQEANGALATVATGANTAEPLTAEEFSARFYPRIPSQPWSAPAYDGLAVPSEAPRVFCMSSGEDLDGTCTCLTEQGTKFYMPTNTCRVIAREGQYEPFYDERGTDLLDGRETQRENLRTLDLLEQGSTIAGDPAAVNGSGNRVSGEAAK